MRMNVNSEEAFKIQSREQCAAAGMDPTEIRIPKEKMNAQELIHKNLEYEEILKVVSFFSQKVLNSLAGTPILIVITDEKGFILKMEGDNTIKNTIKKLGIEQGVRFTQKDLGTNVISLALEQKQPVALVGSEHFFEFLHNVACYSAPFQYSEQGNILGSISIMTAVDLQNSLFLNMLANVVDSIERELLLRKQNRELDILNQIMLQRTQNAIIVTNAAGIVTEFNSFAEILSGFERDDIIGRNILDSAITGSYFEKVLHNEKIYKDMEMKFKNNDEKERICLFDAQPIYDTKNNSMIGAFAQLRDITERSRLEKEYNYLAYHDDLTKLPNRRYFQQQLDKVIHSYTSPTALILIDLDGFKNINDTFGHSYGDKLLQAVADRLSFTLRKRGFLARISGDEFMILNPDTADEKDLYLLGEQLICQFQSPFTFEGRNFYITASIGMALYRQTPPSLEEYMVHVDAAMYKAKSEGKNTYRIFSPEMYVNSREELMLESDLRDAIRNDELLLHYQPQVDTATKEVIGFEALIRWQHPKLGLLSPGQFIPLAEKTGLIIPIGEWVIERACLQHQQWKEAGLPSIKVSVNISAQQFLKQDFIETTERVMESTGITASFLEVEITESMAMDFTHAGNVLERLKALGVQISMDDFGTGYSSLFYLKQLHIDTLKIDKFFMDDLVDGEHGPILISTIMALAKTLGLKVVAEGVETNAQLMELQKLDCTMIQGYYFQKPISAGQITRNYNSLIEEIAAKC